MRHIIVGDLHGKDCWEQIDISKYDRVVFLGDYVDSDTVSDWAIYENLKNIIKLKKQNKEKLVLLLGNHDIQYLYYPEFRCSGFNHVLQKRLTPLFRENSTLFDVVYQRDKYLFSHAGITDAWYNELSRVPVLAAMIEDSDSIADCLNKIKDTKWRRLLFNIGYLRGGFSYGGPNWADKLETETGMLDGYHQVVGHTKVKEPETISFPDRSITYIDVLNSVVYFHELEC